MTSPTSSSPEAETGHRTAELVLKILRFPLTRLVLCLIVFAVIGFAGFVLVLFVAPAGAAHSAWRLLPMELVQAFAALVAMLSVGLVVERATLAGLGFGGRPLSQTATGFAVGAALQTLAIGILALCGWYRLVGAPAGSPANVGGSFLGAVLLFLLGAVFEEVLFRGILFRLLEQSFGTWAALILSAAAFGLAHGHNPGATWMSTIGIAVEAGILLAGAYLVTRNLWLPIGLHWAWNLFEGPVYGTQVSGLDIPSLLKADVHGPALWTGGAFGPEAGLVCVIVAGTLGLSLVAVAVRQRLIFTPPWIRRLLHLPPGPSAPAPALPAGPDARV